MPKRPRRLPILLVAAICLTLATWQAFRWAYPPFAPPVLPVPNGYDQLLEAAELLAPRTGLHREMDEAELATIVLQNKPALALVDKALQSECGVPVDWSHDPSTGMPPNSDRIQSIRNLARAFSADIQSKLANANGSEAVPLGLTVFQLGKQSYRGGLLVDQLVGFAVQGVAINELRQVAIQYPDTRTEIIAGMIPWLEAGESAEAVIKRETHYIHAAVRGYMGIVFRLNSKQMLEPAVDAVRQAAIRSIATQRLFLLHVAVNVYHDQHGTWPVRLADLAPDILATIYLDPYTNANFVYRVEDERYRLYGVGRNGRDDGGTGDESGLAKDFVDDFVPGQP